MTFLGSAAMAAFICSSAPWRSPFLLQKRSQHEMRGYIFLVQRNSLTELIFASSRVAGSLLCRKPREAWKLARFGSMARAF